MQKKKGILIGAIALIIVLIVVFVTLLRGNSLESHLKLAVKDYNDGNYEEAILEFDKAIAIDDKIFHIYLAKANTEIVIGKDDALETTIKMIELLKTNEEITNQKMFKAHIILLDMYNTSEYHEKEDLLVWFYENAYGNEKYNEYILWIEDYLPEDYKTTLKWIREDYEEIVAKRYVKAYSDILLKYKKAMESNYEYDYINGEEFDDKYPGVNFEVATNNADELEYAMMDLNNDEIPELIIGEIGYIVYVYSQKSRNCGSNVYLDICGGADDSFYGKGRGVARSYLYRARQFKGKSAYASVGRY